MKYSNILVYGPSLLGSKFYQVDKGTQLDFKVKRTVELERWAWRQPAISIIFDNRLCARE